MVTGGVIAGEQVAAAVVSHPYVSATVILTVILTLLWPAEEVNVGEAEWLAEWEKANQNTNGASKTQGGNSSGSGDNNNKKDNKWGNPNTLEDHYKRHGSDVSANSAQHYAQKANDFYNNRTNYQVKVDGRGVTRVYDPDSNIFGSYNPDGTTRTFFSPTNGQTYFDSQPGNIVIK